MLIKFVELFFIIVGIDCINQERKEIKRLQSYYLPLQALNKVLLFMQILLIIFFVYKMAASIIGG